MNKKIMTGLCLGLLVYACSQTLYVPTDDMSQYEQLTAGRKLYVDHCSGCHNLHFPHEFTADQWKTQLEEMQVKAKISDDQKELIFQYLISQPSERSLK
jgi:mono/diheme cytochrome c family protein